MHLYDTAGTEVLCNANCRRKLLALYCIDHDHTVDNDNKIEWQIKVKFNFTTYHIGVGITR